jgi:hypothetical protein
MVVMKKSLLLLSAMAVLAAVPGMSRAVDKPTAQKGQAQDGTDEQKTVFQDLASCS